MTTGFQIRFSGPTTGDRYEQWREEFARHWVSADFDPIGAGRFESAVAGGTCAFLSIYTARGTPMHMTRRSDTSAPSTPYLYLMMASGSHLRILQRGRAHDLPPGHMGLLSAEEPALGSQLTAGTRKSLRIPRKLLGEMTLRLDDKVGRPACASAELRQLLMLQVEIAQRLGPTLDAAANHALAQHILDLAALCIGAHKDAVDIASRRGLAAARLDAIKADIVKHLATSEAQLGRIAARHKVSERYVQHLFETAGTTFSGFVLEQRLLRACRLLRDPTHRWRKISDVAAAAGFADISYFNRTFRSRFGATPSDVRSGAASGEG
jgi:AraC-like DNA-binding protein